MQNAFIFPLVVLNPKDICKRGPPLNGCAGRKAGVDTMRVETTFLWMSDPLAQWDGRYLTSFLNLLTVFLFPRFLTAFLNLLTVFFLISDCLSTVFKMSDQISDPLS